MLESSSGLVTRALQANWQAGGGRAIRAELPSKPCHLLKSLLKQRVHRVHRIHTHGLFPLQIHIFCLFPTLFSFIMNQFPCHDQKNGFWPRSHGNLLAPPPAGTPPGQSQGKAPMLTPCRAPP